MGRSMEAANVHVMRPARSSRAVTALQILDFRFWILGCGARLVLKLIQNRKSEIQNRSPRAAATAERSALRSLDVARRVSDRARSRMVASLPMDSERKAILPLRALD